MIQQVIGLMSGTSVDSIDAVLVKFEQDKIDVQAVYSHPIPAKLRQQLLSLCQQGEVDVLGQLDVEMGRLFSQAALQLLMRAKVNPQQVVAIGSHGQTVRHRPDGLHPFTLQIGDPNIIAEMTGITTVADFRRRDMAAGGQGAPLVPAFHAALFQTDVPKVILNVGGMANITVLPSLTSNEPITGFDTGPGNVLLDAWIAEVKGQPMDIDGAWAASGELLPELLAILLSHDFLASPPPKSTGRETFHLAWLQTLLAGKNYQTQDVQATLLEFTALSICQAIQTHIAIQPEQVLICGGGAYNTQLLARLSALLPCDIVSTIDYGLAPEWVEAVAFAWLAQQTLQSLPGNVPNVTGARRPVVLGGIYLKC